MSEPENYWVKWPLLQAGIAASIGRAISYLFAKEGADIVVVYLNEHGDAAETKAKVEQIGRRCLTIAGDIGYEDFCREAVGQTLSEFGRIDILINTALNSTFKAVLNIFPLNSWNVHFELIFFHSFILQKQPFPI
ncbi:NAD(P)-dependent dehydrogenase (short-subunit alcohol dehydrogenase family) [Paenibacillus sp. V4I9]|nr:NAD(P)-dependent dehydrogenase (short-subunit alcohol dehydrogenase family) [Paenibacillus sp. V4I9]